MMQHMETTGTSIASLELEIAMLKLELTYAEAKAKAMSELFDISYKNTNAALSLCDYWRGKYDAIIQKS